jgi:hypothetical protein
MLLTRTWDWNNGTDGIRLTVWKRILSTEDVQNDESQVEIEHRMVNRVRRQEQV